MAGLLGLFLLAGPALGASGMLGESQPVSIRSQSGQFMVRGLPMGPPRPSFSTSSVHYLRLDPNLTAISLERIRQAIQFEFAWPNKWQGLISVKTEPVLGENTRVRITNVRYANAWGYQIVFPEIVDKERFVGAAVETILKEYVNRRGQIREIDVPYWLSEGLTAELMTTSLPVLALEPDTTVSHRGGNPDPMAASRERLRQRAPLSFDDLSMPGEDLREGEGAAHYRACAHLFVHELLRLRDGRASLGRMLDQLHEDLNWQTTFLRVFERHFSRLLDVDQWYSLSAAGIRGRDLSSVMTPAATLQQLDSIILTAVEVRLAAQELPLRTEMKLQRLIAEWDYSRQYLLLIEKIGRLQSLRGRAAPALAPVVVGYLDALVDYVGSRNLSVPTDEKKLARVRPRGDARKLVQQLDDLDVRRVAIAEKARDAGETTPVLQRP